MGGVGRRGAAHAGHPQQARRRVATAAGDSRGVDAVEQRAVGHRQVGVAHDGPGRRGARRRPARHRRRRRRRRAGCGSRRRRSGSWPPASVSASASPVAMACMPPSGHEDALDRVHVGDDGVQRQRLVRRHARRTGTGTRTPAAGARRRRTTRPCGRAGRTRRGATSRGPARQRRTRSSTESKSASMKFGISTRYSSVSQSAKRSKEAAASRPGERPDLLGHRGPTVAHVEHGAVGERGPVHRVDRLAAARTRRCPDRRLRTRRPAAPASSSRSGRCRVGSRRARSRRRGRPAGLPARAR